MKTITMIGLAAALCVPAAASAQRGEGAGAAGVQRLDTGRAAGAVRDIEASRGAVVRGEGITGTRIRPLPPRVERPDAGGAHSTARRRWYNATHGKATHSQPRRRWNAANPPPSRPRGDR